MDSVLTLETGGAEILAASVSSYNLLKRKNRKTKAGRTIRVYAVLPMNSANYKTVRSALDCFLAAA